MASLDVVSPALLLPIPVISLALSAYNWRSQRYSPVNSAVLVLLAVLAAVAGGTGLGAACGEPLGIVASAFTNILESALSAISVYALCPSSRTLTLPPSFPTFFLSLATILVVCELVSAVIPGSPPLLPPTLAIVSRIILLFLAVSTFISWQRHAKTPVEKDFEKSHTADKFPRQKIGRVSSPTPDTWPFPASLASQGQPVHTSSPTAKSSVANFSLSLTLNRSRNVDEKPDEGNAQNSILLPFALIIAQIFATIGSALSCAGGVLAGSSIPPSGSLSYILIADATFTFLWAIAVLAIIQMLPVKPRSHSSDAEKQDVITSNQDPTQRELDIVSGSIPTPRTPKSAITRHVSDSLDFLSLQDPFASSPPPPPPLPPIGLGLDEVDVGWNRNNGIGRQYRFPAPRSIVKGGKHKGNKVRARGKKHLAHQDSSRTLLAVPPLPKPRGSDAEAEKDRGLGDEARLAELLLQTLSEGGEEPESPQTPSSPAVPAPQAAQMPLSSRWSTSTTVRSTMSASISNRSGLSTYVSCTSEKVQGNRISMNTIASVLGSRESSEARRKSGMTASSSRG